jgi:sterol desaturase/sphingolipid hydroxylase (fatty acid hydroxylase superfamily)
MHLLKLEHGRLAYWTDFALYGMAVVLMSAALVLRSPSEHRLVTLALAAVGLAMWTAIEYGLHRFVLHRLQPFRGWHEMHHERPTALICTPTLLSATLIATLVFAPAMALGGGWYACALTLGVSTGYLGYAVCHHGMHHWRADNAWLKRRKHWHALHHHTAQAGCYGVTTSVWDRVFASTHRPASAAGQGQGSA